MNEYLKLLPHINKKFNLGLDIRGKLVYSNVSTHNGRPMSPMELKEVFDKYYPMVKEEYLFRKILEEFEPVIQPTVDEV